MVISIGFFIGLYLSKLVTVLTMLLVVSLFASLNLKPPKLEALLSKKLTVASWIFKVWYRTLQLMQSIRESKIDPVVIFKINLDL